MTIADIRLIYADDDGRVNCFDCPLNGMQNTKCPEACTGKKEAWLAIQKFLADEEMKNMESITRSMSEKLIKEALPTAMTLNDYQLLAARTINGELDEMDLEMHALHGMVGEIGEIHSLYQKSYQGHKLEGEHLKKELGDLMWFIAEFCTARGWNLEDICRMNIDKLEARYPDGFEEERSLKRAEGDI